MTRLISLLLIYPLLILNPWSRSGDPNTQRVFTTDIDNFWIAYDSAQTTTDSLTQLHYIQTLYIDKGTPGLKAFMEARDYSASGWVSLIRKYPKFWKSIRPNTLSAKQQSAEIEASLKTFKQLYPPLTNAKIFFTVGGLNSGGTTRDSMILIGTEIATGNPMTDVSEFENKWLAGVFQNQRMGNIIPLNIHEYVHTQQKSAEPADLLGKALQEGSADFITELVIGRPMENNYIVYGRGHETELKKEFMLDMFSTATLYRWLYNGTSTKGMADLGYFMGYDICKAYYQRAANKQAAISDIIELNYSDTAATENFLKKSGYFTEPYDKGAMIREIEKKTPTVTGLSPFVNGDTAVDPSLKELTIQFSEPMNVNTGYSLGYGEKGKETYPITKVTGYSKDGRSLVIQVALQPAHAYEFVCLNWSFRSEDGYSLKPYKISFKSRP
jgi:Bacterial Ig-like domain